MDKQRRSQTPMIGGSSLLIIFAVLCLTVFALLGFSTVQADRRLSDAGAAAVSEYYEADLRAEEILAELRSGNIPAGVSEENGIYTYTCTISETQALEIEIRNQGNTWEILKWQAVSTVDWNTDDTLTVWDGKS